MNWNYSNINKLRKTIILCCRRVRADRNCVKRVQHVLAMVWCWHARLCGWVCQTVCVRLCGWVCHCVGGCVRLCGWVCQIVCVCLIVWMSVPVCVGECAWLCGWVCQIVWMSVPDCVGECVRLCVCVSECVDERACLCVWVCQILPSSPFRTAINTYTTGLYRSPTKINCTT